jgi:hypothetical protein
MFWKGRDAPFLVSLDPVTAEGTFRRNDGGGDELDTKTSIPNILMVH